MAPDLSRRPVAIDSSARSFDPVVAKASVLDAAFAAAQSAAMSLTVVSIGQS
jgi:hypothetical protein